jgi:4-diphosphocytidyl-2-C-methyl-D-erythritol kinase
LWADAYGWLDADRAAGIPPPVSLRRQEFEVGWPSGAVVLANDLQPAVARRHPAIDEMVSACMGQGAMASAMTGSGSAVFGVFAETAAPKAAAKLHRPDWLVMVTRTLTRREAARRVGL